MQIPWLYTQNWQQGKCAQKNQKRWKKVLLGVSRQQSSPLPLLPSGPGGVCRSTLLDPQQQRQSLSDMQFMQVLFDFFCLFSFFVYKHGIK